MSYSKWTFYGCEEKPHGHMPSYRIKSKIKPFGMEELLQCIRVYCIDDQEFATSVSLKTSERANENRHLQDRSALSPSAPVASGSNLLLLLYEDIFAYPEVMRKAVYAHIGLSEADAIPEPRKQSTKLHKGTICAMPGVACDDGVGATNATGDGGVDQVATVVGIRAKLTKEQYPCLRKQLEAPDASVAWSMPIDVDGAVSISGDCHPLHPLDLLNPRRYIKDLYSKRA